MAPVLHVVAPCGGIMSVTPQVSSGEGIPFVWNLQGKVHKDK